MKSITIYLIFVSAIIGIVFISGCVNQGSGVAPVCENGICEAGESTDTCPRDCFVKEIRILQENAAHGEWSPSGDMIVFDKENADEYFDIYIMLPDGTITKSITENNPKINQRHNGWPAWDPSGNYIVFQSEEETHYMSDQKWLGYPGLGFFSNLWATTPDANQFWKLTDIKIKKTATDGIPIMGIVNPIFSHDGKKLMWTERYDEGGYLNWGKWQVKMADFAVKDGQPRLEPGGGQAILRAEDVCEKCNYVVAMAFSPDDKKLLIAGNLDGQHVYGMDQYLYDLSSENLANLQNTSINWEEGACWSPDGKKIIYPPDKGSPYKLNFNDPNWPVQPRTREYWIMNADGTNKRQLTYFNTPGSPEYVGIGKGRRVIVAECSFSPDGKKMVGIVGIDQKTGKKSDFQVNVGLFEFE